MSESEFEKLWHNDRNCSIITAKDKIDAAQCIQYLRENMRSYSKGSVFLFITGHHHEGLDKSNVSKVGETDYGLHTSIGSEWACLKKEPRKKCEENKQCSPQCDNCKNCEWQDRQFKILRLCVETNNFDNDSGTYEPSETSLDELKVMCKLLRQSKDPYVMVYLSCWSHNSPIKTILHALGIYGVLALKKDRSEITIGQVFKLDDEQEKYLEMVVDDSSTKKDLIIAGKYFLV